MDFTLANLRDAYASLESARPTSSSNFIIDLIRKDRGINRRLPHSIIKLGYDLRHKTGVTAESQKYAGTFVYVGEGNFLDDWLKWPETFDDQIKIRNRVPHEVVEFLRRDEGSLFSVIDYCDALSYALYNRRGTVMRVQSPVKWQPNEIDGLYFSKKKALKILHPVEAKALSTGDDIYLPQVLGAQELLASKFGGIIVRSLAIQMQPYGFNILVLDQNKAGNDVQVSRKIKVVINPSIPSWNSKKPL